MTNDEHTTTVTCLIEHGRDREAASRGAQATISAVSNPAPHTSDGGTSMDVVDQLQQIGPVLGAVFAGVRPEQLDAPTPCDRFVVRDVLQHMVDGATAFTAAYGGEPSSASRDAHDPLDAIGPALGALVAAISAPGALDRTIDAPWGAVDGDSFARYIVLDGLVHGWDLATATGQPYDPPDAVVAEADAFAHGLVDQLRNGEAFAPAVAPPEDATPLERLIAFTGRRPLAPAT